MVKLKWLKNWEQEGKILRKVGEISNVAKKSAENFVSQGYAEYVEEKKVKKKVKKVISPQGVKKIVQKLLDENKLQEAKDYINETKFDKQVKDDKDAEIIADLWKLRDLIEAGFYRVGKNPKEEEPLSDEEIKQLLGKTYEQIKEVLKEFVKLKKEYYDVVAIWILGTYFIKSFETFPYLFINAQKGSGKTRLLKLIEQLANEGELLASMREAVLFRIASDDKTILIDELEGLERKENAALRELLNSCYKRGTKVYRMRKVKDDYVAEPFYPFTPIVIANISGIGDVLGDRCVRITLDKDVKFSLKLENFTKNVAIQKIKSNMETVKVYRCRVVGENTIEGWNNYIDRAEGLDIPTYTHYTHTTHTTHTNTQNTPKNTGVESVELLPTKNKIGVECEDYVEMLKGNPQLYTLPNNILSAYNKIRESGINGRHLELFFPLLTVARILDMDIFDKLLNTFKKMTIQKKEDDIMESDDVSLIDFIARMKNDIEYDRYRPMREIFDNFRKFLGLREREREDISIIWLGLAIKRLGLIVDKKRVRDGVEVRLNIPKAIKLLENLR